MFAREQHLEWIRAIAGALVDAAPPLQRNCVNTPHWRCVTRSLTEGSPPHAFKRQRKYDVGHRRKRVGSNCVSPIALSYLREQSTHFCTKSRLTLIPNASPRIDHKACLRNDHPVSSSLLQQESCWTAKLKDWTILIGITYMWRT